MGIVSFLPRTPRRAMAFRMQFLSDNAAAVHPQVWQALRAAERADTPYDTDAISRRLDEAFSELFGREVAALGSRPAPPPTASRSRPWSSRTAAVLCHREAHIEMDEAGAPASTCTAPSWCSSTAKARSSRPRRPRRARGDPRRCPPGPGPRALADPGERIRPLLPARRAGGADLAGARARAQGCTWTAHASPTRPPSSVARRARRAATSTR